MDVISSAVPALYGCTDESEIKRKLLDGTLESQRVRLNVRGVLRMEGNIEKKYIAEIGESSLSVILSQSPMQLAVGLAEMLGDLVIPVPVERVEEIPMLGLAVRSVSKGSLGAHRVLLLVQFTCPSKLDAIDDSKGLKEQAFKIYSSKVRCLLSASEQHIDLVGYCDFDGTLTYRLDKEAALVLVSAVSLSSPDSVSAGGLKLVAVIEHMQKVSSDDKASLLQSLDAEWKSVLVHTVSQGASSKTPEYWDQPASKLRRLASEPVSPSRKL